MSKKTVDIYGYKSFLILKISRTNSTAVCIDRKILQVEFWNSIPFNKSNRFNCFKRLHNFQSASYVICPERESLLKSMVFVDLGLHNALFQCDRNYWSRLAIGTEDAQITKWKIIPNPWQQCRNMTLTLISHLLIIYVCCVDVSLVSFQLTL